jgi:hypothetical protein
LRRKRWVNATLAGNAALNLANAHDTEKTILLPLLTNPGHHADIALTPAQLR